MKKYNSKYQKFYINTMNIYENNKLYDKHKYSLEKIKKNNGIIKTEMKKNEFLKLIRTRYHNLTIDNKIKKSENQKIIYNFNRKIEASIQATKSNLSKEIIPIKIIKNDYNYFLSKRKKNEKKLKMENSKGFKKLRNWYFN